MTETKLGNEHDTSEFLTEQLGNKVHRNDKRWHCGGVLINIKECHNKNEVYNAKIGVVQWVEHGNKLVKLKKHHLTKQWLYVKTTPH